jgi:hypothetical protein
LLQTTLTSKTTSELHEASCERVDRSTARIFPWGSRLQHVQAIEAFAHIAEFTAAGALMLPKKLSMTAPSKFTD